jgi:hypothetical protein
MNNNESTTKPSDSLAEAMYKICYEEILEHMNKYKNTTDSIQLLSLMEPFYYRRFLETAQRKMVGLISQEIIVIFNHIIQSDKRIYPAIVHLQPNRNFSVRINEELSLSTQVFFVSLAQFEQLLHNFRYKLQNAGIRAENQGTGWGMLGAIVGGAVFGPVGAYIGACGAGYFGGTLIEEELQEDGKHLEIAFRAMLGEYDNTMERMVNKAHLLLNSYCQAIEDAINN